jgi:4-amino-4-deoxy-L-arabinose transferase-like glycosyltransferase
MRRDGFSTFWRTSAGSPYLRVGALSLVLLGSLLYSVNTDYVWVSGMEGPLNDQVGYVSVARTFAESGELRSGLIYPSLLNQNTSKNYPYMPGHYFALASSYLVFGYSPLSSFLPSLLAYVIGVCALLALCLKLVDRTTAYLAAFIFLTFPGNLVFSVTAMAEMTFVAAGLVCMAIFVHLPASRRPYLGPILLLLPVLFRETGAVLLIPMIALIMSDRAISWKRDAVVTVVLSLVLVSILVFVIFGDRPSFLRLNLVNADFVQKYLDAFWLSDSALPPGDWVGLLARKMRETD